MGSGARQQFRLANFRGGINQEVESAGPTQLLDARNMWCPDGKLVQRPGYVGLTNLMPYVPGAAAAEAAFASNTAVTPNTFQTIGLGTQFDADKVQVGDYYYLGTAAATTFALVHYLDIGSTANSAWAAQYWNGTAWVPLVAEYNVVAGLSGGAEQGDNFLEENLSAGLAYTVSYLLFAPPKDWATTTVNSATRYFVRVKVLENALNPRPRTVTYAPLKIAKNATYAGVLTGAFAVQFLTKKVFYYPLISGQNLAALATYGLQPRFRRRTSVTGANLSTFGERATCAVAPMYNEAFIACQYNVMHIPADIDMSPTSSLASVAQVETAPEIVGTIAGLKSPYHPDYIPQLSTFPKCKYITYFDNGLFAANLQDNPHMVRWSVQDTLVAAHKVWPDVSFDIVGGSDNDNSPITGLATLNENLVVFKQDSIWSMVYTGEDENGLGIYVPKKLVAGIGTVSNKSIAEVNGRLVFLAEDGVYAFDGTPAVQKLSGPIDEFVNTINDGRRHFASGIHWRTKHCYLLSMPTGSSDICNAVLVWDYKANAWWIWDSIEAQTLFVDEGPNDEEIVCFTDNYGLLYQLDVGDTDHGAAISSYVLTHRLGYGDDIVRTWRDVTCGVGNSTASISVQVTAEDEDTGTTGAISYVDSAEAKLGAFVLGTSTLWSPKRRERGIRFRECGQWAQVRVAHSTKDEPFELYYIKASAVPMSAKR